MPFVSKAQRGWMYANEPEMAKKWQAHTPKGKKLPEHVAKKPCAVDAGKGSEKPAAAVEAAGMGQGEEKEARLAVLRLLKAAGDGVRCGRWASDLLEDTRNGGAHSLNEGILAAGLGKVASAVNYATFGAPGSRPAAAGATQSPLGQGYLTSQGNTTNNIAPAASMAVLNGMDTEPNAAMGMERTMNTKPMQLAATAVPGGGGLGTSCTSGDLSTGAGVSAASTSHPRENLGKLASYQKHDRLIAGADAGLPIGGQSGLAPDRVLLKAAETGMYQASGTKSPMPGLDFTPATGKTQQFASMPQQSAGIGGAMPNTTPKSAPAATGLNPGMQLPRTQPMPDYDNPIHAPYGVEMGPADENGKVDTPPVIQDWIRRYAPHWTPEMRQQPAIPAEMPNPNERIERPADMPEPYMKASFLLKAALEGFGASAPKALTGTPPKAPGLGGAATPAGGAATPPAAPAAAPAATNGKIVHPNGSWSRAPEAGAPLAASDYDQNRANGVAMLQRMNNQGPQQAAGQAVSPPQPQTQSTASMGGISREADLLATRQRAMAADPNSPYHGLVDPTTGQPLPLNNTQKQLAGAQAALPPSGTTTQGGPNWTAPQASPTDRQRYDRMAQNSMDAQSANNTAGMKPGAGYIQEDQSVSRLPKQLQDHAANALAITQSENYTPAQRASAKRQLDSLYRQNEQLSPDRQAYMAKAKAYQQSLKDGTSGVEDPGPMWGRLPKPQSGGMQANIPTEDTTKPVPPAPATQPQPQPQTPPAPAQGILDNNTPGYQESPNEPYPTKPEPAQSGLQSRNTAMMQNTLQAAEKPGQPGQPPAPTAAPESPPGTAQAPTVPTAGPAAVKNTAQKPMTPTGGPPDANAPPSVNAGTPPAAPPNPLAPTRAPAPPAPQPAGPPLAEGVPGAPGAAKGGNPGVNTQTQGVWDKAKGLYQGAKDAFGQAADYMGGVRQRAVDKQIAGYRKNIDDFMSTAAPFLQGLGGLMQGAQQGLPPVQQATPAQSQGAAPMPASVNRMSVDASNGMQPNAGQMKFDYSMPWEQKPKPKPQTGMIVQSSVKRAADDDSDSYNVMLRRPLDRDEEEALESGRSQFFPAIPQDAGTPIPELMASPWKQSLMAGLVAGGLGGAAGNYLGGTKGLLLGAALAGLPAALTAGIYRREKNEDLEESMRRLPPGSTKRDYDADQVVQQAIQKGNMRAARMALGGMRVNMEHGQ